MVEVPFKTFELGGLGDELGLHLRGHLLVEWELFDNKVVIIQEGLVDVILDIVIKIWLNVERLIGFLDLLDPHVERIKLLVDEVLKVVGGIEDRVNTAHKEREEDEADELEGNREDVLLGGLAYIVTVSNGGDDLEDPVESEDVLGVIRFLVEIAIVLECP